MPQVAVETNIPAVVLKPLPNPRLARVMRDLDQVARLLDDLQVEIIEVLREQGSSWADIGDCYEPTKSRQALQKWVALRRERRGE